MSDFDELMDDLKQARDKLRVQVALASMEVKDEWVDLESRWQTFSQKAEISSSANEIGGALDGLGQELKKAYQRIASAMK